MNRQPGARIELCKKCGKNTPQFTHLFNPSSPQMGASWLCYICNEDVSVDDNSYSAPVQILLSLPSNIAAQKKPLITKLSKDWEFDFGQQIWPKDSMIEVELHSSNFTVARVKHINTSSALNIPIRDLHQWSKDFVKITEEMLSKSISSGDSVSITGESISVYACDKYGFPSVLFAWMVN